MSYYYGSSGSGGGAYQLYSPYYTPGLYGTSSSGTYGTPSYGSTYNRSYSGTYVVPVSPSSRTSAYSSHALSSRYQPKLSTITETSAFIGGARHSKLMPLTRNHSPKFSTYSASTSLSTLPMKYIPPRPIPINTADIDVSSSSRYRKRFVDDRSSEGKISTQTTTSPSSSVRQNKIATDGNEEDPIKRLAPSSSSTCSSNSDPRTESHQRSTIKRNRNVVRLSTMRSRSKERSKSSSAGIDVSPEPVVEKSPKEVSVTPAASSTEESISWRQKLADELAETPSGTQKKSPGDLIRERYLIQEKEASKHRADVLAECRRGSEHVIEQVIIEVDPLHHTIRRLSMPQCPSFHEICEDISSDKIDDDLNAGELRRRASIIQEQEIEILNQLQRSASGSFQLIHLERQECPDDDDSSRKSTRKRKSTKKIGPKKIRHKITATVAVENPPLTPILQESFEEESRTPLAQPPKFSFNVEAVEEHHQIHKVFKLPKKRVKSVKRMSVREKSPVKEEIILEAVPAVKPKATVPPNTKALQTVEVNSEQSTFDQAAISGKEETFVPAVTEYAIRTSSKPQNAVLSKNVEKPETPKTIIVESVSKPKTAQKMEASKAIIQKGKISSAAPKTTEKLQDQTKKIEDIREAPVATPKPIQKPIQKSDSGEDFWSQIGSRETLYMTNRKKAIIENQLQAHDSQSNDDVKPLDEIKSFVSTEKIADAPKETEGEMVAGDKGGTRGGLQSNEAALSKNTNTALVESTVETTPKMETTKRTLGKKISPKKDKPLMQAKQKSLKNSPKSSTPAPEVQKPQLKTAGQRDGGDIINNKNESNLLASTKLKINSGPFAKLPEHQANSNPQNEPTKANALKSSTTADAKVANKSTESKSAIKMVSPQSSSLITNEAPTRTKPTWPPQAEAMSSDVKVATPIAPLATEQGKKLSLQPPSLLNYDSTDKIGSKLQNIAKAKASPIADSPSPTVAANTNNAKVASGAATKASAPINTDRLAAMSPLSTMTTTTTTTTVSAPLRSNELMTSPSPPSTKATVLTSIASSSALPAPLSTSAVGNGSADMADKKTEKAATSAVATIDAVSSPLPSNAQPLRLAEASAPPSSSSDKNLSKFATVSNLARCLQDVDADLEDYIESSEEYSGSSDSSYDSSSENGCAAAANLSASMKKKNKQRRKKEKAAAAAAEQNRFDPNKKIKIDTKKKCYVKEEAPRYPLVATPRPLWKREKIIYDDDSDDSESEETESESECSTSEDYEDELNPSGSSMSSAAASPAAVAAAKEAAIIRMSTCSNDSGFEGGTAPSSPKKMLETSYTYSQFQKSGRITAPATTIPRFKKYSVEDFHFLTVLGKGSFGKVLLAELRNTDYYYAVKCLKKDVVLEDDDVECTLIERKVLALGTKHPYLCHLFCTFQTESHLFFVMEYLNGGDLMFHIQESGRFAEERARFYGAEIISGLKFLHKKGIIYRDLKLDNVLLDFDGHVRIADFGMCKLQIYLDKTADSFCGTPDYMAPEIIKGDKYNQNVDWWSFGVLLYEMLIGQSPFSGCDEDELFWSICNEVPWFPVYITLEATSILKGLLEKDSTRRIGSHYSPAGDICDHIFFRDIDWGLLEKRQLEPPFKPQVKHPLDTQYFDRAFTRERVRLTPIDKDILQSMDQEQFQGFSYTNPNATLD